MKLNVSLRRLRRTISRKSPEIAIAFGIAGFVLTVIEAVKSTPKAVKMLEEKKKQIAEEEEIEEVEDVELTPIEFVTTAGKCYIPTVLVGGVSVFLILFAQKQYTRRIAGLTTALTMVASDFNQYKEKVREVIGLKKEEEVRFLQNEEKLKERKLPSVNKFSGDGKQWCFCAFNGNYFRSSMQELESFREELNSRFTGRIINGMIVDGIDDWIPVRDFEDRFPELPDSDAGILLGWNREDGEIEFHYTSHIMANGETALVVSFDASTEEYSGIKKRYPVNQYY